MRNLKKFLALVLAMMMVFSLMVTANAATSFEDDADINPAYAEAAQVLQALGIYEGEGDNKMNPKGTFDRAELATIAYRVGTGSTADDRGALYADYSPFTDLAGYEWAAGYISFAWNAQWVHGESDTTFNPGGEVTGYHVLALLLQMMGYGKNGEFIGPNWRIETARLARDLGITAGLSDTTLNSTATREVVAELVFEAMLAPMVSYYALTNSYLPLYVDVSASSSRTIIETIVPESSRFGPSDFICTLGYKWFRLEWNYAADGVDEWGRPGYYWFMDADLDQQYNRSNGDRIYTTITDDPVYWSHDAVPECDVYAEVKGVHSTSTTAALIIDTAYYNGANNTKSTHDGTDTTGNTTISGTSYSNARLVQAADTKNTIGQTGRLTEIYDNYDGTYDIVYIDTLLAKVTDVTKAAFDTAGHLKTAATLYLDVYSQDTDDGDTKQEVTVTNGDVNYPYVVGDYLLINAVHRGATTNNITDGANAPTKHIEIVDVPDTTNGTQTRVWYNRNEHTVNGEIYPDNNRYHLDAAGRDMTKTFTWFFDQYGNLIGSDNVIASYDYGVVTYLEWIDNVRDDYALADIMLVNGDELTNVVIGSINGKTPVHRVGMQALANVGSTGINISIYPEENANPTNVARPTSDNSFVFNELFAISFDDDGVAYLDQTPVSEITNAAVTKGSYRVTGNGDTPMSQNSATQYLVRTGSYPKYKFDPITGYNNISSLGTAHVDYVKGGNGYARFAFLYGSSTTTDSNLVYVLDDQWAVNKNGSFSVTVAYLDDSIGEVTVAESDEGLAAILTQGVGTLFYVEYVNGLAVTAIQVPEYDDVIDMGSNMYVTYIRTAYWTDDALANNKDPNSATIGFNVTNSTIIYGDDPENGARIPTGAYVMYNKNSRNATYIYIPDEVPNISDPVLRYGDFEMSEEDFAGYLEDTGDTIEEGVSITLTPEDEDGDVTITTTEGEGLTIAGGGSLTIGGNLASESEDIIVDEGGTLEVDGSVASGIESSGDVIINGDVKEGSEIKITGDGTLTVNGTIEAKADITVESLDAITIEKGSEVNEAIKYEPDDDVGLKSSDIPAGAIIRVEGDKLENKGPTDPDSIMGTYEGEVILIKFYDTAKKGQHFVAVVKGPGDEGTEYREIVTLPKDVTVWTLCPSQADDLRTKSGDNWSEEVESPLDDGYYTVNIYASDDEITDFEADNVTLLFSGGFTVNDEGN